MHFVYICRSGENEELRYSIRSVLYNIPDALITVVGGKPDWYCGHYIEVKQTLGKYKNARENILEIIKSDEIPEEFILMNDDFYIMKPIDDIPIFHGGPFAEKVLLYEDLAPKSSYTGKLIHTYKKCKGIDHIDSPKDYELHIPFKVKKSLLLPIIRSKDTKKLWRSFYGNYYSIGGEQIKDVKIYTRGPLKSKSHIYTEEDIFISSDDSSFEIIRPILQKKYKKRSALELTPGQIKKKLV